MKLTNKVKQAALAAFKSGSFVEFQQDPCYGILAGRKLFQVQGETVQMWLSDNLGLNTNDNMHVIGGFIFWFDWGTQTWRVGA